MAKKTENYKYTSVQRKEMIVGYLMLLPAVVLITIFVIIPFIMAVQKSFYEWNFYKDDVWVGIQNFRRILRNKSFQRAVVNAFKFVLILVPTQIIIQFSFAHTLRDLNTKFTNMVKMLIYIPGTIAGIIAGIIFMFIFEFKGGLINQLVVAMGLERIAFKTNRFWAIFSIAVPTIWLGLGGGTILNFAGLINIPTEFYEAASIDGASGFHKLIYITIPQMRNIFVLQCIGMTTGTLQMFEIPMMMTGGAPRESTLTPMLYIYNGFRNAGGNMGDTISGALLMMIIIAIINSFVFTIIKSEKSIEG
ncbi:MAG: carbohydrate ABC transporter permease [Caldicoprobacterales bacterium]|jgi:multiple sugar transport system permease protein|nr:sugar ABC transporter permease [Clostridiales bacterium]